VLREILSVSFEQGLEVVFDKIDFSFDASGLSRLKSPKPEIAVQAPADSLEKFLIGFPCCGEEHLAIHGVAADEAVVRDIVVERAGVDIGPPHPWSRPNLSGDITGLRGPVASWHHGSFAIEEKKTFLYIGVGVLCFISPCTRKYANPHARLGPVRLGTLFCGVVSSEAKVDLVVRSGDQVFDPDAILEDAGKFDSGTVFVRGDKLGLMTYYGVLDPVGGLGVGSAIGFQVMNAHRTGKTMPVNSEPVFLPSQRKFGGSGQKACGEQKK
jgi:hypothetical protein